MREWRGQRKEPGALVTGESVGFWGWVCFSGLVQNAVKLPSALGHFSTQLPTRIRVILVARPESEF